MIKVGLFDSVFSYVQGWNGGACNLHGENSGETPHNFRFVRNERRPVTFYTDGCLDIALNHPADGIKVAWLVESREFSKTHYVVAAKNVSNFDYIISHDRDWLDSIQPITSEYGGATLLYAPLGGSWIKDWAVFPKVKEVSMMTTDKIKTDGHLLRRDIQLSVYSGDIRPIVLYGRGSNPIESKATALRSYKFSVVVEPTRCRGYFTEKLIDCFSQGTVPIYWGDPEIERTFHPKGVIPFETSKDLDVILDKIWRGEIKYEDYFPAIWINLEKAKQFRCIEDWLFGEYPQIFTRAL